VGILKSPWKGPETLVCYPSRITQIYNKKGNASASGDYQHTKNDKSLSKLLNAVAVKIELKESSEIKDVLAFGGVFK
jgi:hypothetical protein